MNCHDDITWLSPGSVGLEWGDPSTVDWFQHHLGPPTLIQQLAWPAVASGKNLLISAPTGSGKTLAAFLPLLASLKDRPRGINPGQYQGLYIAPLRALTRDIGRNLSTLLANWETSCPGSIPGVAIRNGDTTPSERQAQKKKPAEILLTTPESLAILLSQIRHHCLFLNLKWIIVDEIHAIAGNKRGADLVLSLERLEGLTEGGLQRIGLSATAKPLEQTARFLVGMNRPCHIAVVEDASPLEIAVNPLTGKGSFLSEIIDRILPVIQSEPGVLIFTNTRNLAERISWALRLRRPDWDQQIAVHHSSLSAIRRLDVESRFKEGILRCVVSSTSLELGIDIGKVTRVILVHPPGDVIRLLQRLGRSGHDPASPGRKRRGLVLTTSPPELLEAAVTVRSSYQDQRESLRIPEHPLDVLCQHLIGLAMTGPCQADVIYPMICRAYPYRNLSRKDFNDTLDYLLGKDHRGEKWLPARLKGFRHHFRLINGRTARLLRRNLGTLQAAEDAIVQLLGEHPEDTPLVIGQLNPQYADRLKPGDRFLLDGRCLEFRSVQRGIVQVRQTMGNPGTPIWGGTGWPLSAELAQRLFILRLQAAEALLDGPVSLKKLLQLDLGLGRTGVEILASYFQEQDCLSEIPDFGLLLIEIVRQGECYHYYLHTPLNRLANDALSRVLSLRLAEQRGRTCQSIVADLGLVLVVRGEPLAEDQLLPDLFRSLLEPAGFPSDLDSSLENSGIYRQRFQEVAMTGLMLLRNPLGGKRKVGGISWGETHLFDQVQAHDPDFVLLRQAAREIRDTECDVKTALDYVQNLPGRVVRCRWLGQPSPFARYWTQRESGEGPQENPADALLRLHASLLGGPGGQIHAVS